jgi:secreted trypsin-like serine protease
MRANRNNRYGSDMNVFLKCLAAMAVVSTTACGGGGSDEVALPSAAALCGSIGLTPRIANGSACSSPQLSPVVLLYVLDAAGASKTCSGTLITPTKVLTAAHCLPEGTLTVLTPFWQADGSARAVRARNWAVHPGFQATQAALLNDAAVITLASSLPNPTMPLLVSQASAVGQAVFLSGWGAPSFELSVGYATLTTVNEAFLGFTFKGRLSNACSGDSGGPVYRAVGGRNGVVGLTSSGTVADCGAGDQSLFTNLQNPSVLNFVRAQAPARAEI